MEIQIKSVITRTEFEAQDEGIRLAGAYEKNQSDELTQLSATAYNGQNNVAGQVRGYRTPSGIRYDYNGISDDDIDTVRTLTVAVVDSTVNPVPADSPADNNQEGGES